MFWEVWWKNPINFIFSFAIQQTINTKEFLNTLETDDLISEHDFI